MTNNQKDMENEEVEISKEDCEKMRNGCKKIIDKISDELPDNFSMDSMIEGLLSNQIDHALDCCLKGNLTEEEQEIFKVDHIILKNLNYILRARNHLIKNVCKKYRPYVGFNKEALPELIKEINHVVKDEEHLDTVVTAILDSLFQNIVGAIVGYKGKFKTDREKDIKTLNRYLEWITEKVKEYKPFMEEMINKKYDTELGNQ